MSDSSDRKRRHGQETVPTTDVKAASRRLLTASGRPVSRLGLAAREDRFAAGVDRAAAAGINLFFTYGLGRGEWVAALAGLAADRRPDIVIATGSGSRRPSYLRRSLGSYLKAAGTDYLDIYFAEYVHPGEELEPVLGSGGALDELAAWKRDGLIRYVGATAHDRGISRRLAEDPRVDVLMQRYNMAHRKAATEVFPACRDHGTIVIAFTATRWGTLPAGHEEWDEPPPGAADCHRFCIAHPDIAVTLMSPADEEELEQDLTALRRPSMGAAERRRWERYGDLVYGTGRGRFETAWP